MSLGKHLYGFKIVNWCIKIVSNKGKTITNWDYPSELVKLPESELVYCIIVQSFKIQYKTEE